MLFGILNGSHLVTSNLRPYYTMCCFTCVFYWVFFSSFLVFFHVFDFFPHVFTRVLDINMLISKTQVKTGEKHEKITRTGCVFSRILE